MHPGTVFVFLYVRCLVTMALATSPEVAEVNCERAYR